MGSVQALQHLEQVESGNQVSMSMKVDIRQVMAALVSILQFVDQLVNLSHNCHFEFLLLNHKRLHRHEKDNVCRVEHDIWHDSDVERHSVVVTLKETSGCRVYTVAISFVKST